MVRGWGTSITNTALLCQLLDKYIKQLETTRDPPGPPGTVFHKVVGSGQEAREAEIQNQAGKPGQRKPRGSQEIGECQHGRGGERGSGGAEGGGGEQVLSTQEHRSQVLPAGATDKTGAAQISRRQVCGNRIIYNRNSNLWEAHLAIHAVRYL